jgi:integrase
MKRFNTNLLHSIVRMTDHILKQGTRVLTPLEYEALRSAMDAPHYPIICDAMLLSGMRPIEFSRFQPDWYKASRRTIKLPQGACLKVKCQYKERTINLSLAGCDAFDRLVNTKVKFKGKEVPVLSRRPAKVSFNDTLKRYAALANIGTDGIAPKMFRKTLVSWLVACYPEKVVFIASSMGHDYDTIIKNYLGLGFTREEVAAMKEKYLSGWGEV